MDDVVELPEDHASHEEYRHTLPVSLTISILAVLVAGAALLSHRAHTEELLLQSQATDQWAYYQAKNIRCTSASIAACLVVGASGQERRQRGAREYSSPGSKPTGPWPAIAAATPPCARDGSVAPRRQPARRESKSSAKPAAYADTLHDLRDLPEAPRHHPSLCVPFFV